ncbi:MAG: Glu/Leu/Phe/Val dehydrogenase [Sphingomonadales bacterium]
MSVFESSAFAEHDLVHFCRDRQSGLRAIIAVHDTKLGPACGGCRMWPYQSEQEAIQDVLRLSRGMSYKNAMANLPLGGGKSVIIGDPKTDKSPELFRAFGRFVNGLGGVYITAEDVGVTVEDMELVAQETNHVAGLKKGGAASGDPSPVTAFGVYKGIQAAARHKLGVDNLAGVRISVQGLGHVGYTLCRYLHDEGAELAVTDIDQNAINRVVDEFGATAVGLDQIFAVDVDIFAPCALGAGINDDTIPQLKASIIAGAANNQLAEARHDQALMERGILYAPDYVINAGGIINVTGEILGDYHRDEAMARAAGIYDTLGEIFAKAEAEGRPTGQVADAIAFDRLEAAQGKRDNPRKVA